MNSAESTLSPVGFLGKALRHRDMIFALAGRELLSRYVGTLGGVLWAIVHPLATVVIFYFVFAIGFRAHGPGTTPFILWFVCGQMPWFFFNDTLQAITNSVTGNVHLVKKTVFPTEVLPLVHVVSSLLPHLIFMSIVVALAIWFGIPMSFGRLLVVYYLICAIMLLLGLGWLLSALQVFYRDIGQALTIVMNMWFWATPIVWPVNIVPAKFQVLLKLNPIYYIVDGYRNLLIYNDIVWPSLRYTLYFWCIALVALCAGIYVFRRLKPEFADVI